MPDEFRKAAGVSGRRRRGSPLTYSMRRPRGEAAQLILETVAAAHPEGLTLNELRERTGLPVPTLRENVKGLEKARLLQTFRDEHQAVWVCLPG